jgi:tricorn protease
MGSDSKGRYYDWVSANRAYVAKNGGPNIGYIHMPDMEEAGFTEFSKWFYANLDKDALVIDVRYNNGGLINPMIIERLRRTIFEYDQPRYGQPSPYHPKAFTGKLVLLCNENSSSDGEYVCTDWKANKLGPTVGTRTWGGYMAVDIFPVLDGGIVSTPVVGSFSPDGKWLPDGTGFTPDYIVEEDEASFAQGRDPQLDKAIELLKDALAKDPPKKIKRLDPPSKEKAFGPNKKGGG